MEKTKRRMVLAVIAVLLVTWAAVPWNVAAEDLETPEEEPVIEGYNNIDRAQASLSISGGTAYASAWIEGISGVTTQLSATVQLQKRENGTWKTVYLWNASSTSVTLSTSRAISVSKGTYRVYASVVASSGSSSEFINSISTTRTY